MDVRGRIGEGRVGEKDGLEIMAFSCPHLLSILKGGVGFVDVLLLPKRAAYAKPDRSTKSDSHSASTPIPHRLLRNSSHTTATCTVHSSLLHRRNRHREVSSPSAVLSMRDSLGLTSPLAIA